MRLCGCPDSNSLHFDSCYLPIQFTIALSLFVKS